MSHHVLLRRVTAGALLIALAVVCGSAPAASAAVPRLRLPQLKPRVTIPDLPPLPRSGADLIDPTARYGDADPEVVAALDDAAAGVDDDVEATASRVALNASAKLQIKRCAREALVGAGTTYRDNIQDAYLAQLPTPAPGFKEVSGGAFGCMQRYFDDTPEELFKVSEELANLAYERAQEASEATPYAAVLARWMVVSGEDIDTDIDTDIDETSPLPEDGPFPWLPVIGVVVVLAIGGALYARRSKPGA